MCSCNKDRPSTHFDRWHGVYSQLGGIAIVIILIKTGLMYAFFKWLGMLP